MRMVHEVNTNADSELHYFKVLQKSKKHSGPCSSTSSDAVDRQKERRKVVRAQNYRRNQAQKDAEKKAAAEKTVDETPDIPAK